MLRTVRCEGDPFVARPVTSTESMHERPDLVHPPSGEERDTEAGAENELSYFLIAYLLSLLGALLLVHVLQPERQEGAGSSSQSPIHQERRNGP